MVKEENYKGYILSRKCREVNGRDRLHYIGISDHGPFTVAVTENRPLFFIQRDADLPKGIGDCQRRRVDLENFEGLPVDALYFKTQRKLSRARRQLEAAGIRTFEADIRPEERYLMERFIHGAIEFKGPPPSAGAPLQMVNVHMQASDYRPGFSVLSLDIETGQKGELYSIACHFKGRKNSQRLSDSVDHTACGFVLMVDAGMQCLKGPRSEKQPAGIQVADNAAPNLSAVFDRPCDPLPESGVMYRFPGEKDLLEAFLKAVAILDPDIIIGWHVVGFDLRFLEEKFKSFHVPFSIGRFGGTARVWEVRKGVFRADISGRIVIDGPPALRAAFYSFENFRLETVASEVLGKGKDIGEDMDKVAEIERRYREDKISLAHYNLQDCHLVSGIFSQTGLIDLTFKRATLSGLPMDRVGMSVAAFDFFMLPRVHRHGYVAPNVQDIEDTGSAAGGWVFVKSPGFFDHVAVFDFKSLYPSIIRTFKIDPLSRLEAHKDALETPVGVTFSRTEHILPEAIAELMAKREQAKKDKDPHLSQAIKILMNSFYGVMGTPGCRFYDHQLPASITGTGQWILKLTRSRLEEAGYDVLYGDTDSVFVQLKKEEQGAPEAAAKKLVQWINTFITDKIRAEFGLESYLEIEFERHFRRLFLPAVRGGGEGAKKRYVGMVTAGGKDELMFTGLEFVRSDWTRFAKNFQYELFDRIFHDREVTTWIKRVVADLRHRVYDGDLTYVKRLRKAPREYTKVVPPHVKAALLYGEKAQGLKEIQYVMTRHGPVPQDLPHADLDYNHYIDKQLKPIADAVLQFLDLSFSDIIGGRQLKLF